MDWRDRIVVDPDILVGKPVVKGTRLVVEFIVQFLPDGWTREEVLACLAYVSPLPPRKQLRRQTPDQSSS